MRIGSLLLIISLFQILWIQPASAQSISITEISPESPSYLKNGQDVTIKFRYTVQRRRGVRIFVRPITNGKPTPGYGVSGSKVFMRGSGSSSARFTIRKGAAVVDQLRLQILAANGNNLIYEFFVPVKFTFGKGFAFEILNRRRPGLSNIRIDNIPRHKEPPNSGREVFNPVMTDSKTDESVLVKRIIKNDGTIESHFSDGSIRGYTALGKDYFVTPEGDTLITTIAYIQIQDAAEPAPPPGQAFTTSESTENPWVDGLNAWVEYLGSRLLLNIEQQLTDSTSYINYLQFEQKNSSTIYQKVDLRYTFLEKLR